ncbi:hypothetical protein [Arthrobacter sp. HLT1-21]
MSDQAMEGRLLDLEVIADMLTESLGSQPGLLRLEPTVRSVMKRLKIASVNTFHQTLRSTSPDPIVATRDGMVLSLTDGVVNLHLDIATEVGHPALSLARELQAIAAETIQRGGLAVGHINVTILAIEGTPLVGN